MNILWMCNIKLNLIKTEEERRVTSFFGGGWMEALARMIIDENQDRLVICYPQFSDKEIEHGFDGNLSHWGIKLQKAQLDRCKYNHGHVIKQFQNIIEKENIDIIHIHGSEYPYSYDLFQAAKKCGLEDRVVLSIQGLIEPYAKAFCNTLPQRLFRRATLSEMKNSCSLRSIQKSFYKRAEYEAKLLCEIQNVMGRTDWDYAYSFFANPNVNYFKCNETLRSSFYDGRWSIEKCERHSIIISQASSPLKGFHMFLETANELRRLYPDLKVYVTGTDIFSAGFVRGNTYGLYIKKLIKKMHLDTHIEFVGTVDENEMKEYMLRANVFVSPSAIENSPNSLGEAMLLGLPCVCSDVGGVKSMMQHGSEGYVYPFADPVLAAYYIMRIFEDDQLANGLSKMAKNRAMRTHNGSDNYLALVSAYKKIIMR